jgi:hypothetical protein
MLDDGYAQNPLAALPPDTKKKRLSAKVCRLFKKLHTRGLIAKIPHPRQWRITRKGLRVLGPLVETYA